MLHASIKNITLLLDEWVFRGKVLRVVLFFGYKVLVVVVKDALKISFSSKCFLITNCFDI